MTARLLGEDWGYCSVCHTFVIKRYEVSLRKGIPSGWRLPPHDWQFRTHTRSSSCGTSQPYNPRVATGARLAWQRSMLRHDAAVTAFVINANNEKATRST